MAGHGIHSGGSRTMFSLSLSEVTSTHTTGTSQSSASVTRAKVRIRRCGSGRAAGGSRHAQYSVWPRSRRNCSTEKPSTMANSTHAIAEAAPNWKKFWNAVS